VPRCWRRRPATLGRELVDFTLPAFVTGASLL
jgi:hypothetical protein